MDAGIGALAALDQPLRRRLYALLVDRGGWTSRDEAAAAIGVSRSVAAFHLDKLADAGVVEVSFERTSGRTGPGAGRPSKLYRPAAAEVSASVPQRRYDLAGSLLAAAVDRSARTGAPVAGCVHEVAREAGSAAGAAAGDSGVRAVTEILAAYGYEPDAETGSGEIVLRNCPFHSLAEEHRELVCGMNLDFLTGVVDEMAPRGALSARLAPAPGFCCVRLHAAG